MRETYTTVLKYKLYSYSILYHWHCFRFCQSNAIEIGTHAVSLATVEYCSYSKLRCAHWRADEARKRGVARKARRTLLSNLLTLLYEPRIGFLET